MARILKTDECVNGYRIVEKLNHGAMAISYEALGPDGAKVFLKQYKSPAPTVPWYEAYKLYQTELKNRVTSTDAAHFCYKFVDFFEASMGGRSYYQVFEFVEKGSDLGGILDKVRESPSAYPFDRRLILARVLMAGLASLHRAGIVHCDLKPPNLQLIEDSTIRAGYVLKVIDMDFSILTSRRAPWDDGSGAGYVGSPNYRSPEHLASPPPTPASDIFTCGLILYELLAQGNPYAIDGSDDDDPADIEERYKKAVLSHSAPRPRLEGHLPAPGADEALADTLYRCLSPRPKERPTADEVLHVLRGDTPVPVPPLPRPKPTPVPRPPAPPPEPPVPTENRGLRLVSAAGPEIRIRIRTEIGKYAAAALGDDAKHLSQAQFTLEPGSDGRWQLIPMAGTKNETLLNGKAVTKQVALKEGDVIGVGREAKGIVKLPLTVRLG